MSERFVKVDLDCEECEAVAELAENAEALARLRNWDATTQQRKRVVVNRVRYKMNVASTLFNPTGQISVATELPPWLKSRN